MRTSSDIAQQFFSGTTEHVFQVQLGLVDPKITDYLSAMMLRFMRTDHLYKVRNERGQPIAEVVDMIEEACYRCGVARRKIQQHIGDFTLFWAGLFPEALKRFSRESKIDYHRTYCCLGRRSYREAARTSADEGNEESCDLLLSLSDQFEMCAYGLREVRREWEE